MDFNDLKLFPAVDVVQVTIQTADPLENPNWKHELQADAAYEGAVYAGLVDQTAEDSLTLLVPKSDLRTWEQTASANGADLSLKVTGLSGAQGLKRFHLD